MEMMRLQGVFLLLAIARVEGLGKLWKFRDLSNNERTAKMILQSCYPNDNLIEPIIFYGNFNKLIDESSVVRLNHHVSLKIPHIAKVGEMTSKASKILLMSDSPETLIRDLHILQWTRWWNHMARFFIVSSNKKTCEDFKRILEITWAMNMLNSIYICAESINVTALYTLNPMANYAPHPWKKLENLSDLNVFYQIFDPNVSCVNLHYDKTKILNAYEVRIGVRIFEDQFVRIGEMVYPPEPNPQDLDYRVLEVIIRALNTSVRLKPLIGDYEMVEDLNTGASDITMFSTTLTSHLGVPFFFPHKWSEMIAVVKLSPERSTLQKIFHMWSRPVLIAAGIALLILFLILTIKNRSLCLAMLDIIRLLTYTSIHTDARGHWFRIYFTTMLIFMIISNGVFQGRIAAFLIKQERVGAIETIDELVKLEYHMYTSGTESFAMARCSKCSFKRVKFDDCINYVLNNTRHVCGIERNSYEMRYPLLPLEIVKEILNEEFENLKCRFDWPLRERVNNAIMRLVESNIIDFWKMKDSYELVHKRKAMEAEWSSAQYKPVRLYKLIFAFQVLVCGLGLAIIVFFLEFCQTNYGNP